MRRSQPPRINPALTFALFFSALVACDQRQGAAPVRVNPPTSAVQAGEDTSAWPLSPRGAARRRYAQAAAAHFESLVPGADWQVWTDGYNATRLHIVTPVATTEWYARQTYRYVSSESWGNINGDTFILGAMGFEEVIVGDGRSTWPFPGGQRDQSFERTVESDKATAPLIGVYVADKGNDTLEIREGGLLTWRGKPQGAVFATNVDDVYWFHGWARMTRQGDSVLTVVEPFGRVRPHTEFRRVRG